MVELFGKAIGISDGRGGSMHLHPPGVGVSVVNRVILAALNRCEVCRKAESKHQRAEDEYTRDSSLPVYFGWHAARRGLGSNLYRLGVPRMVIQRILRHANVSTTATCYIKTAADDVRNAMAKLENRIAAWGQIQSDTIGSTNDHPSAGPTRIPWRVSACGCANWRRGRDLNPGYSF
jgi:hypothetical protein